MAKYRITDPDTGQAYMVTGDGTQEEAMQEFMDHQAEQSQPANNQAQTQLASQAVMEKRLADEATAKEAAKEAGLDPLTRLSHFIDKKIGTPKFITDSADSATDYFPPANALKAGLSALSGQNMPQASRIMAQGLPIFGHMIPDDAGTSQYRTDNPAKSAIMKGEGYAVPALALAALTGGSSMPILAGGAAQGGMAGLDERSRQINENTENRPDDMRNVALNTAAGVIGGGMSPMLSKLAGPGLKGLVSSALAGGAIKRGYDYIGGDTTPAWDSIRQGMMLGVGSKLLGVGNKAAGTWGEVIKDSPVLNALTKVTSGMGNVAGKTANVAGKYAPILGIHYTQSLLDALSTESDK